MAAPGEAKKGETKESAQYRKMSSSSANAVKQDGILKELVQLQKESQKNWDAKWGFMKNYDKFLEEEAIKVGLDPGELRRRKTRGEPSKDLHDWKVPPSSPVPTTSAGFIGWRSSVGRCSLERVGPLYTSPVSTINPPPPPGKARAEEKQNVIFIG